MKKVVLFIFCFLSMPVCALAWDGFDYKDGTYIEIEQGNLVRSGQDIEIFDYADGRYKDVEVVGIDRSGSSVEVEVYDPEQDEFRTFEMD